MPGTITDDIEIIDAGHGGGTDVPPAATTTETAPAAPAQIPRRAYFTALQLGTGRHRHVLHGADQLVHGAQGPGERLGSVQLAAHSLVQHTDSAGQQRHHSGGTAKLHARAEGRIRTVVGDSRRDWDFCSWAAK